MPIDINKLARSPHGVLYRVDTTQVRTFRRARLLRAAGAQPPRSMMPTSA